MHSNLPHCSLSFPPPSSLPFPSLSSLPPHCRLCYTVTISACSLCYDDTLSTSATFIYLLVINISCFTCDIYLHLCTLSIVINVIDFMQFPIRFIGVHYLITILSPHYVNIKLFQIYKNRRRLCYFD